MDDAFAFEKLDVYRRALQFSKQALKVAGDTRLYSWRDQMSRASMSIVLNIAEGAGRWHAKEKRQFYYIARGSVFECVPLIELGQSLGVLNNAQRTELRSDCQAIAQMLTKLIQSVDS